jgi:hypothetical protein
VLPLDDRGAERFVPEIAGRPTLIRGKTQVLFPGMGRLTEYSVVTVKNRAHAITAELDVPASGAEGVVVAQGGSFGGWSLYAKDGRLRYCYNFLGLRQFTVETDRRLPAGNHRARMEFHYDGGGLGKGGDVVIFLDGDKIGSGRIDATVAVVFSADESCDVGRETGALVTTDYGRDNVFTGKVQWVQIDLDDTAGDDDTQLTIAERLRVAMAKQ